MNPTPMSNGDLLIGVSIFVWVFSLVILLAGLVLVCIRSARRIGLFLLAGSVGTWILSMGMCAAGIPRTDPVTEKRDTQQREVAPGPTAAQPVEASVERERPAIGNWRRGEATMDGAPSVSYRLNSPDKFRDWVGEDETPTLVVRCHQRRTEVYVVTALTSSDESIGDLHTVRLRYDDQQAPDERWSESTDDEALFAPDGIAMAKRIVAADTMRFEFTPFLGDRQAATFHLAGVSGVVGHVAQACGWTP
jgi:hypothetical protein